MAGQQSGVYMTASSSKGWRGFKDNRICQKSPFFFSMDSKIFVSGTGGMLYVGQLSLDRILEWALGQSPDAGHRLYDATLFFLYSKRIT
jgi:hypothetical protein